MREKEKKGDKKMFIVVSGTVIILYLQAVAMPRLEIMKELPVFSQALVVLPKRCSITCECPFQ